MDMYQAELGHLLALSPLTPGSYEPTERIKAIEHVGVFVDGKPFLLTGSSDDHDSFCHAQQFAESTTIQVLLETLGITGEVTFGVINGADIEWLSSHSAVVESTVNKVEHGDENGELVYVLLDDQLKNERALGVAVAMCVDTSLVRVAVPDAPELTDLRDLSQLAKLSKLH